MHQELHYIAPFTQEALLTEILGAIQDKSLHLKGPTSFESIQRWVANRRGDIIKNTRLLVEERMKLPENNRIHIGLFPDVSDITATEVGNSPILHRYFVAGAHKALGHKFKGLSYPLLAMLWVGLAYALVQPGDPVLLAHDPLYTRAFKKLKACASLETLTNKLWGENHAWKVDPAAPRDPEAAAAAAAAAAAGGIPTGTGADGASMVTAPAR